MCHGGTQVNWKWVYSFLKSLFYGVRECFAFPEVIYQRALALEFGLQGLNFVNEFEMPVYYKSKCIGKRRVDFLIEEKIALEIKATSALEDIHLAQAINYLEAYNLEVGLLINFGKMSLEFKRLRNKKLISDKPG